MLYFGANKLYRSFNQGNDWQVISSDLTNGGKPGNVPYGTLTSICESPLKFGLLYAGSDDGLLHVTRDGGETWNKISDSLIQNLWVSRVQASAHERGRVYVALNGYRWDDFLPYLYVSQDYGQHWERIGLDLPFEPINVVREDPSNPNILYVGTDHNVYISLDGGQNFHTLSNEFPNVPVHDLAIQTKSQALVIGTHGRSMFKADLSNIQKLLPETLMAELHIFEIQKKKYSKNWGQKQPYKEAKNPELSVWFFTKTAGKVSWSVRHKDSKLLLNSGSIDCSKGLNHWKYTLDFSEAVLERYQKVLLPNVDPKNVKKNLQKPMEIQKADTGKHYLQKGVYTLTLEKGGKVVEQELVVE